MEALNDIGSLAGLAAVPCLIGMTVLYIVRARQVRELRRTAPYLAQSEITRQRRLRSGLSRRASQPWAAGLERRATERVMRERSVRERT